MEDVEIKGFAISWDITADYFGQTEGGKPNGWGKATFPSGKTYNGEWKDGKMHGMGQEFYNNGILRFEGEYKNGYRDGFGKAYLRDGKLFYEGNWKNGEQARD